MDKNKTKNTVTPINKHICPYCHSIEGHYDDCWLKKKKTELDKLKGVE